LSIPALNSIGTPGQSPSGASTIKDDRWLGAFIAGLSGWTLDAFDFFLVVLALTAIGKDFGQSVPKMLAASWATLALRPVGAFLFGGISDRFGRRRPLVANLLFFSVVELATAFTHSYTQFIVVRALFGIVMGGQWGLGAALAMEKVPVRRRGILSGLFQQGYAIGFLFAAAAYFTLFDRYGWRPLFFVGSIPALITAALVAFRVTESESWKQNRSESFGKLGRTLASHWKLLLYFTVFMMAMHMTSHGTQDMYPTFLEKDWGIIGKQKAAITAIGSLGAIVGGLSIGWISDRIGRRLAMRLAMGGALLAIPLWAFSHTLPLLILGAALMQFCVQGAWGVVPAHVAEVSPDSVRGTLPGIGNQVGVVLSGSVAFIQALIARSGSSYAAAMAMTAATVFCLAGILTFAGHEHRSRQFGAEKGK
jgi:MFS transporter, SHS family, lactate transporter